MRLFSLPLHISRYQKNYDLVFLNLVKNWGFFCVYEDRSPGVLRYIMNETNWLSSGVIPEWMILKNKCNFSRVHFNIENIE